MRRANRVLADHLQRAGLPPARLAARINALLGDGYVSRSTVSEWVHAGRVPREPLPGVVAALLSETAASSVRVEDLWPGACPAPAWLVPAHAGLEHIAHSPDPARALAEDWIKHAVRDQGADLRIFIFATGRDPRFPEMPSAGAGQAPANGCWSTVAQAVSAALTGLPAGPAALHHAHRQILAFCRTVIEEGSTADTAVALSRVTAAAGRLAQEAGERGLAQRYRAGSGLLAGQPGSSRMWMASAPRASFSGG